PRLQPIGKARRSTCGSPPPPADKTVSPFFRFAWQSTRTSHKRHKKPKRGKAFCGFCAFLWLESRSKFMALDAGTIIGPYEIAALIGAGGMGEVYRARDTRLRRDVAIKFSAERFSERFEREARAVAALNHPNVCTLFDVGPNYLVMELVDGATLADRIRQG